MRTRGLRYPPTFTIENAKKKAHQSFFALALYDAYRFTEGGHHGFLCFLIHVIMKRHQPTGQLVPRSEVVLHGACLEPLLVFPATLFARQDVYERTEELLVVRLLGSRWTQRVGQRDAVQKHPSRRTPRGGFGKQIGSRHPFFFFCL